MIICDRCKQDLAPLKTFDFISADLHHAKCVFGSFRRVEVEDALESTDYEHDRDFCKLYSEMHEDELNEGGSVETDFAFCECRKKHIVGIVKGQKFFVTDISQVQLMFPTGVYETWDSRFMEKGYVKAFQLQDKLNFQRASITANQNFAQRKFQKGNQ